MSMTDREALLAAVRESPGDDTPRLIFADWCEENGEEQRAAFIRAQIWLSRKIGPYSTEHYLPLPPHGRTTWCESNECFYPSLPGSWCEFHKHRDAEETGLRFLSMHGDERNFILAGDWCQGSHTIEWQRGFIESLSATWPEFITHASVLLAEHPIRRVKLMTLDPYFFEGGESDEAGRCHRAVCRMCRGRGFTMQQEVPPSFSARLPYPNETIRIPAIREVPCTECPNEWTCEKFPGVVFETPPVWNGPRMRPDGANPFHIALDEAANARFDEWIRETDREIAAALGVPEHVAG